MHSLRLQKFPRKINVNFTFYQLVMRENLMDTANQVWQHQLL